MQTRELDHATIAVANTTNISGTATADKIKRGLRSEKRRSQWRISGLPGLGSLMATGIFVALTLLPARAGQGGVPAEIAALQAQVAALQSIVGALQSKSSTQQAQITVLQSQLGRLQTSNSALQSQVNTLQTQLVAVQSNKALQASSAGLATPPALMGQPSAPVSLAPPADLSPASAAGALIAPVNSLPASAAARVSPLAAGTGPL